jgi:hypothetical protein
MHRGGFLFQVGFVSRSNNGAFAGVAADNIVRGFVRALMHRTAFRPGRVAFSPNLAPKRSADRGLMQVAFAFFHFRSNQRKDTVAR